MNEPQQKWAITERWTERLGVNFTPVADAFLRYGCLLPRSDGKRGLTPSEVVLVVQLMSFKWTREAPFPSQKTLAQRMGMSERAVRNIICRLENDKYVVRHRRRHNEYDLSGLFKALERLLDEQGVKLEQTAAMSSVL